MRQCAFTLIEMLVVLAIMGLVAGMVIPSSMSTLRSFRLASGARAFADQLKYARQLAIARNRSVEVRFYQYVDSEAGDSASTAKFRAMQLFDFADSGTGTQTQESSPLGKAIHLPPSVIMDRGQTLSSMVPASSQTPSFPLPDIGINYSYFRFRFRADGSTDLPRTADLPYLTLHDLSIGDALTQAPANYLTIQIDPSNGHIKTFRP